jgi:glycosyltransferase involved in cell wall biosynthesis
MDHDSYSFDPSVRKFEQPTILYVGRLKRYKSVDIIIRALPEIAERVPRVRLAVVGSGDNIEELKQLARNLNLAERVVFPGFVSEDEKVDWMRRSQVIVNPSPREGWGLTNIEANACGTPAVASDVDGLRDSVRDGVTGLLFPYGDHRALAERLIRILTDDTLRNALAVNALAWADTFTWENAGQETIEIIDRRLT